MHNLNWQAAKRLLPGLRLAGSFALGTAIGTVGTLGVQHQLSSSTPSRLEQKQPSRPATPRTLTIDLLLQGEPVLGKSSAPVTVVEFSDYECPYCRLFQQDIFPQLKRDFIDKGLVRFIHKDLPLPFHPQAEPSAAVARCAQKKEAFWQVHSALFAQQTCLACRGPAAIAVAAGLDDDQLKSCLKDPGILEAVRSNASEAGLHDIRATPTFVIGPTIAELRHRGRVIEGALPWPQFQALIKQELAKAKPSP